MTQDFRVPLLVGPRAAAGQSLVWDEKLDGWAPGPPPGSGTSGSVTSVNGVEPDENGNVVIDTGSTDIKVGGSQPVGGWWLDTGLAEPGLIPVTPEPPTFDDQAGTANDTYTIPTTTGVIYKMGGSVVAAGTHPGSGTVTVVAEPASGYGLVGQVEWSYTFLTTSPLVWDDFDRADTSGTLGTAVIGGAWYQNVNNFSIVDNAAQIAGTSTTIAYQDCQDAESISVRTTLRLVNISRASGIFGRGGYNGTQYQLGPRAVLWAGLQEIRILDRAGNQIAAQPYPYSENVDYDFRATFTQVAGGIEVAAYVDDTLVVTGTDTNGLTGGIATWGSYAGFWSNGGVRYLDFEVTEL